MTLNPKNSYIVSASAGTGKTYLLAMRFLELVACGSAPESILTITFTKKAAAEMKERIFEFCKKLTLDLEFSQNFTKNLEQHVGKSHLSSKEVASRIFENSSRLRVMTMDSLFYEWLMNHQFDLFGEIGTLAFEVAPLQEIEKIKELSWQSCLQKLLQLNETTIQTIVTNVFQKRGFFELKNFVRSMEKHDHALFMAAVQERPMLHHFETSDVLPPPLKPLFESIGAQASKGLSEKIAQLETDGIEESAVKNGIFSTKTGKLSGRYVREKLRKTCQNEIETIETHLNIYFDNQKIEKLNQQAGVLASIYSHYQDSQKKIKRENQKIEFSDLLKLTYPLWQNTTNSMSQFFIINKTNHLLIDEFQDTSRLQWAAFEPLVEELLSGVGSGDEIPTILLVGDVKQSIYGFREAEPKMMEEIKNNYPQLNALHMNDSYRTSKACLHFLNQVFGKADYGATGDFPKHQPSPQIKTKASHGSVSLLNIKVDQDAADLSKFEQVQAHAEALAVRVQSMLNNEKYQCFDEELGCFRTLDQKDVLILYRASTHAHIFDHALLQQGIEVAKQLSLTFFDALNIQESIQVIEKEMVMVSKIISNGDSKTDSTSGVDPFQDTFSNMLANLKLEYPHQPYKVLQYFNYLKQSKAELQSYQIQNTTPAARSMTIHQAKGLEAPLVLLVDTDQSWEKMDPYLVRTTDNHQTSLHYIGTKAQQPLRHPTFSRLLENVRLEIHQESWRLLYVAMTRASHHLLISGVQETKGRSFFPHLLDTLSREDTTISYLESSQDFYESFHEGQIHYRVDKAVHSYGDLPRLDFSRWQAPQLKIPHGIRHILPHQYIQKSEEQSHQNRNKALIVGNFTHLLMENYFAEPKFTAKHLWEKFVAQNTDYDLSDEERLFETISKGFDQMIGSHSWQNILEGRQHIFCELPFSRLTQKSLIRGKIDLVVEKPHQEYWVIDLKTGHPNLKDPEELKQMIHGEGIHLQLQQYSYAVRELFSVKNLRQFVLHSPSLSLVEL